MFKNVKNDNRYHSGYGSEEDSDEDQSDEDSVEYDSEDSEER